MVVFHVRRCLHPRCSVWCECIGENIVKALGEFEFAPSGPEESFPCLAFAFDASNDIRDADSVLETVLESEVEEVGNIVDEAVAGTAMKDLVFGVTERYAMAVLIHRREEEAADNHPQSRGLAAALAWAVGGLIGCGSVGAFGDSEAGLDRVTGGEKGLGAHLAGREGDTVFLAEDQGEEHDDAIVASFGVVVESSKRCLGRS